MGEMPGKNKNKSTLLIKVTSVDCCAKWQANSVVHLFALLAMSLLTRKQLFATV